MQSGPRTLILALGNIFREDDGISAAVLHHLETQIANRDDIDLLDGGTAGLDCALLWDGYDDLIVIDAAEMGLPPGAWRAFSAGDLDLDDVGLLSIGAVHAAGLKEALALGRALGNLPERVTIFGIQPDVTGYGNTLSASLIAAIPEVCQEVFAMLTPEISQDL
jgi:hydrogenase maturation protease